MKPEFVIAAAADLRFAMGEIIARFQPDHPGVVVKATYGSSGTFVSQIEHGAPYDIFCSADAAYPRQLMKAGLAIQDSEFRYAAGRIVVWVPAASPIDVTSMKEQSFLHPSVRHVSIANPGHAPYGRAAIASLRSLGMYEPIKDKLAYGENVSQALVYAQQGSAQIGIVALSLALAPGIQKTGRYWELPLDSYPPMEQSGVILSATKNRAVSEAFRTFMLSEAGRTILKNYGFSLP